MATETQTCQQSHVVIRALEQRVRDLQQLVQGGSTSQWAAYCQGRLDEARDLLDNVRIALSEPDAQS
jgi:uncharacterized protein YijF (DUF1287 family)